MVVVAYRASEQMRWLNAGFVVAVVTDARFGLCQYSAALLERKHVRAFLKVVPAKSSVTIAEPAVRPHATMLAVD